MKQMFNTRTLYVIEHSVCAYLNILIIVECLKIQAIIILVKLIILRHYTFLNKYTIHATYLGRFIKNAQLVSRLSKVGLEPTFVPRIMALDPQSLQSLPAMSYVSIVSFRKIIRIVVRMTKIIINIVIIKNCKIPMPCHRNHYLPCHM